jgi:hypothetical protein
MWLWAGSSRRFKKINDTQWINTNSLETVKEAQLHGFIYDDEVHSTTSAKLLVPQSQFGVQPARTPGIPAKWPNNASVFTSDILPSIAKSIIANVHPETLLWVETDEGIKAYKKETMTSWVDAKGNNAPTAGILKKIKDKGFFMQEPGEENWQWYASFAAPTLKQFKKELAAAPNNSKLDMVGYNVKSGVPFFVKNNGSWYNPNNWAAGAINFDDPYSLLGSGQHKFILKPYGASPEPAVTPTPKEPAVTQPLLVGQKHVVQKKFKTPDGKSKKNGCFYYA